MAFKRSAVRSRLSPPKTQCAEYSQITCFIRSRFFHARSLLGAAFLFYAAIVTMSSPSQNCVKSMLKSMCSLQSRNPSTRFIKQLTIIFFASMVAVQLVCPSQSVCLRVLPQQIHRLIKDDTHHSGFGCIDHQIIEFMLSLIKTLAFHKVIAVWSKAAAVNQLA